MEFFLRDTTENDIDLIYDINKSSYKEAVMNKHGQWNEEEKRQYYKEKFYKHTYYIIEIGNKTAGLAGLSIKDDHIYLSDIKILPEWQGKGLGTQILKDVEKKFSKTKLPLRLDVLKTNQRAIALYEKLGFSKYDKNEYYFFYQKNNLV